MAVRSWLGHALPSSLDVVLLDPPYELADDDLDGDLAALLPALAPDALVVVERRTSSGEPTWPPGLALEATKSYGDTVLWWARHEDQPVAPDQAS